MVGSVGYELFTTGDFVDELHRRLDGACDRIDIQLMTFDGDAAGLPVAERLIAAAGRGVSVRLLIDGFALRFVSDESVRRPGVRAEFDATLDMYERLRDRGVLLGITNPNGPLNVFNLARNHKKLFVVDDVVYLGGINVSEHNFGWHDFMVRIDHDEIVDACVADFETSFGGRRRSVDRPILTNEAVGAAFDELILSARERVVVASPYAVDRRLARLLDQSDAPDKRVIVASENNFRSLELITPYVLRRLTAVGADLFSYDRFSHAKFVIADDRLLIGSSNFGRHSFRCNQEIGLIIDDRAFVSTFAERMLGELKRIVPTSNLRRWGLGWITSAGMEMYITLYARLIAPHVPPLHSDVPRAIRRR